MERVPWGQGNVSKELNSRTQMVEWAAWSVYKISFNQSVHEVIFSNAFRLHSSTLSVPPPPQWQPPDSIWEHRTGQEAGTLLNALIPGTWQDGLCCCASTKKLISFLINMETDTQRATVPATAQQRQLRTELSPLSRMSRPTPFSTVSEKAAPALLMLTLFKFIRVHTFLICIKLFMFMCVVCVCKTAGICVPWCVRVWRLEDSLRGCWFPFPYVWSRVSCLSLCMAGELVHTAILLPLPPISS